MCFDRSLGAKKHFINFKLSGINDIGNRILGCVWITFVDKVWKHMNKNIFKNGRIDQIDIFTMVQLKVWSWVTSKVRLASFSYSS